ncbi:MAG: cell envelope integrity protein TolA [Bacteroidota bacterium]
MRNLFRVILLLYLFFGTYLGVQGQVQDCSALCNASFQTVFSLRCPASVTTDANCSAEIQKMLESFKQEDMGRADFLVREYCSASLGWRIKAGRYCEHGGPPPCCVAKDLPWERVSPQATMSAYRAEQKKIYDQRQKELDRLAKSCAQDQQNLANQAKQKQADLQKTQAQKQAELAKQQETQRKENEKKQAIAAENQRKAYLAELERKEAERKRKQAQIDLKAQTNYTMMELGNNLQQLANERTVANFGSGVNVDKDQIIENPLNAGNSSGRESAASEITRNSQSLDDMDFEKEYLKAALEPVGKKVAEQISDAVGEAVMKRMTGPEAKHIAEALDYDGASKLYKFYTDLKDDISSGGNGSEVIQEKVTDMALDKMIPNKLIKEHVSLNLEVIKGVTKKTVGIMDNTFAKIDDFFKELPDDEEGVPSNRGYQTVRNGRSYFRPGNDEPESPVYNSLTKGTSQSPNKNSSSNSSQSMFFNASGNNGSYVNSRPSVAPATNSTGRRSNTPSSGSSSSGSAGSVNEPRNASGSSNVNLPNGATGNNVQNSQGNVSGNSFGNTPISNYPVYNYRYTPNKRTQPPPPTNRQQAGWARVQKKRVTAYDAVPPPELRKGYWELNFCAFYCNFR